MIVAKRCVYLLAYDAHNSVVLQQSLSFLDWYDELHPVIDSATFRQENSVVRVEGVKFNELGRGARWITTYANDGSVIETKYVVDDYNDHNSLASETAMQSTIDFDAVETNT